MWVQEQCDSEKWWPVSYTHLDVYKRQLTYHNSNTHKIANTFRKHKYKIAYRTNNTIKKHINDTNTDIDKYNNTGVYQLNCNDCNSFYLGQTGRSFSSRYSEPVSYTHLDVYKRQGGCGSHPNNYGILSRCV